MDLLNIQPNVVSATLKDKIFLFYGEPGTRKTSVASLFPNHIIAGFEQGYSFIEGAVAQPISSWVDFRRFIRELKKPEVKKRFETVVLDTVSLMLSACEAYVLTNMQIEHESKSNFGEAYTRIRREFETALLSIPQMGYGLVMIAHSEESERDGVAEAKINLNKKANAIVKGLADFILYTRHEMRDGSEGRPEDKTVYAYSDVATIETKRRARYFPRRFEFTYPNLVASLEAAVKKQKEEQGIEYNLKDDKQKGAVMKYKVNEIDFDKLKENTISLASGLLSSPLSTQAEEILFDSVPQGLKLSTLTKAHVDLLNIIYDRLLELQANDGN